MKTVDFYFDYLSPFAYLASITAPEACGRQGAQVHFRPILFAGLLDHWGQRGPAEIPPKGLHSFRSCFRYAVARGIPLRSPRYHPFRPLLALRSTLAVEDTVARARAVRALFDLGWARGGDLGDAGEIAAALDGASLDGAALIARAGDEAVKRLLRDETSRAIERGVFGIPTLMVDEEPFWGLDQLDNVELVLAGRDPLAGVDFSGLGPLGASARRPRAG